MRHRSPPSRAFFEYAIKKDSGKQGDLTRANIQADEYLETMPDHNPPQAIILNGFTISYLSLSTIIATKRQTIRVPIQLCAGDRLIQLMKQATNLVDRYGS